MARHTHLGKMLGAGLGRSMEEEEGSQDGEIRQIEVCGGDQGNRGMWRDQGNRDMWGDQGNRGVGGRPGE